MSNNGKERVQRLARRILRENKKGRSYRIIAREDYPTVKAGTLNRIANSKGEWIPKDECILIALGLKKPRKPPEWRQEQSIIEAMSYMTKQALRWKKRKR